MPIPDAAGKQRAEQATCPIHETLQFMHIGMFFSGLAGGGTQRRMLALARGFVGRGHEVDLLVASANGAFRAEVPPEANLVALGADRQRLPLIGRHRGLWVPLAARALGRRLEAAPPDVLLASSTPANLTASWVRRRAAPAVPLVLTLNLPPSAVSEGLGPGAAPLRLLMRRCCAGADALIAISTGVAADAAAMPGLGGRRISVVPNPIDAARIEGLAGQDPGHPWLDPEGPPLLLAVGKLKAQKDLPTVLEAFARVRKARPARLVVLGDGEERRRLERLARRLDVAADVAFLGFVANPFAWMARARVLVSGSRFEGFSNVLAEGLTLGCTIVSTDCPHGPRELLDGGRHGRLVPVGDAPAMATALLEALDDPADRGLQRARAARFSLDRAVTGYLEVLAAVAAPAPQLAKAG